MAYHDALCTLMKRMLRLWARALELPPEWFDDKFNRPIATLRPLHYPPTTGEEVLAAALAAAFYILIAFYKWSCTPLFFMQVTQMQGSSVSYTISLVVAGDIAPLYVFSAFH